MIRIAKCPILKTHDDKLIPGLQGILEEAKAAEETQQNSQIHYKKALNHNEAPWRSQHKREEYQQHEVHQSLITNVPVHSTIQVSYL